TGPAPSVVRSSSASCSTTTWPSTVAWTSSSRRSAPTARPAANASRVFSGCVPEAPRCANRRGRGPSRYRVAGSVALLWPERRRRQRHRPRPIRRRQLRQLAHHRGSDLVEAAARLGIDRILGLDFELHRVEVHAALFHFVVEVRARGEAGGADVADHLTAL